MHWGDSDGLTGVNANNLVWLGTRCDMTTTWGRGDLPSYKKDWKGSKVMIGSERMEETGRSIDCRKGFSIVKMASRGCFKVGVANVIGVLIFIVAAVAGLTIIMVLMFRACTKITFLSKLTISLYCISVERLLWIQVLFCTFSAPCNCKHRSECVYIEWCCCSLNASTFKGIYIN